MDLEKQERLLTRKMKVIVKIAIVTALILFISWIVLQIPEIDFVAIWNCSGRYDFARLP